MKNDLISRQQAIKAIEESKLEVWLNYYEHDDGYNEGLETALEEIKDLPSAQPKYEPVTAEDFAKTMSENTLYSFMAWYNEAVGLMERQGFVICKKTM